MSPQGPIGDQLVAHAHCGHSVRVVERILKVVLRFARGETFRLADVEIDQHIELEPGGEDLAARVADIKAQRARLSEEEARVKASTEAFAKQLAGAHVPVRDIGSLLGVTFQRASQLVNS